MKPEPEVFLTPIDTTDRATAGPDAAERPFPLAQRYRRRVLPLMALFVVSLVLLTAVSVRQAVRDIHLEFAARQVDEIAAEVAAKAPAAWKALFAGTADADHRARVALRLAEAASERGLSQLKVYLPTGEAVFRYRRGRDRKDREERGADRCDPGGRANAAPA